MGDDKRVLLRSLFAMEQLSPSEVVKLLQKDGLIANNMSCDKCNKDMTFCSRSDTTDKFGWRCSKCGSRKSIRTGSWFSQSHLPVIKILQSTYMWVMEFRIKDVVRELELAENTVTDRFNFCQEVCVEILLAQDKEKIGGPGVIVEIDEAEFGKRKYNRGNFAEGQCIFGGTERDTGKCFLEVVEEHTPETLVSLIQNNIKDGTIIISDCWKAYDVLGKINYEHLKVNHSINFKNRESGAHINTMKGTWACLKRSLPQSNRSKNMISSYFAAFMYRRMRKDAFDPYKQFIEDVIKIYSAQPGE